MDFGHPLGQSIVFAVHVEKDQVQTADPKAAGLDELRQRKDPLSGVRGKLGTMLGIP